MRLIGDYSPRMGVAAHRGSFFWPDIAATTSQRQQRREPPDLDGREEAAAANWNETDFGPRGPPCVVDCQAY